MRSYTTCSIHSFHTDLRAYWHLVLSRPGDFRDPVPSSDRRNPAHEGLAIELARQARALGAKATVEELRSVLVALCRYRPMSRSELAAIAEQKESTLRVHLNDLVQSSELVLVAEQYRAACDPSAPPDGSTTRPRP